MTVIKSYAGLIAASWLICHFGGDVRAQDYPAKAIRIIVPGSTGSGQDVLGRLVFSGLAQTLGQQVIVDNRPGASGNIGAEIAAKQSADGYTLLVINIGHPISVVTRRNLPYDLVRDFAPVTQLALSPGVLVVHPSLPAKSVGELVRLAKARPGAINYASAGPGSSSFVAVELFKGLAGISMLHVPYNGGGPAVTALVTGEVSVGIPPLAASLPHIRQGRLRALAVTTARRLPMVPGLPSIAEAGVAGYEFSNWYGLVAPAKTQSAIIAKIRNAVASVLNSSQVRKSIGDLGGIPVGNQPEEFAAYIKSQIATMEKIFQRNRVTVE